jgi:hypothetical protein
MRSARNLLTVMVLGGFLIAGLSGCRQTPTGSNNTAHTGQSPAGTPAPSPNSSPLSSVIPHDADFSDNPSTLQQIQHDFDVFSWQSFVALNWPTDPNQIIGAGPDGDNQTVWGTYIESYQVFLPDGQAPSWDSRPLPPDCQSAGQVGSTGNLPVFRMTMKVSDQVLNFAKQAFGTGPLIDQRGDYARYAIHLNQDAFNYILNNQLYNQGGQAKFGVVSFPIGDPKGPVGAIVLKSAWRILDQTKGDDLSRYHKINAYVYTPKSDGTPAQCQPQTLGLVGLHIAHKTTSAPQWVWSTFEQVDNVQVGPNAPPGLKPSFFNPDCNNCPVNKPPPKPWNPTIKTTPSQVTRVIPLDDATMQLNAQWQGFLKQVNPKSVWQYYELISTQWPTQPAAVPSPTPTLSPGQPTPSPSPYDPHPTGNPAPQFLANTTIETYIQGKVPNSSSSCIMCHNNATTTKSGQVADFSYLLERAQKEKQ